MAVDIPLLLSKTAALTGIALVWGTFTVNALKLSWHIATFSLEKKEEDEEEEFYEEITCEDCKKRFSNAIDNLRQTCSSCKMCLEKTVKKIDSDNYPRVICEECQAHFIDSGEVVDDGRILCANCRN